MEIQELDITKKLPHIRTSNPKIIILISVVVMLIVVNVIVILYGRSQKNDNSVENVNKTTQTETPGEVSIENQITDFSKEQPVLILGKFFDYLKEGNIVGAEGLVSEYSSPDNVRGFMDETFSKKETVGFKIIKLKYSQQKNFAYITVEVSEGTLKSYKKITLIKVNSVWKVNYLENL